MSEEKRDNLFKVTREGEENVLRIDFTSSRYSPNIEDSPTTMSLVIDALIENPDVHRIIFLARRNYVYDYKQTQILLEISNIYKFLVKQKKILTLNILLGIPGLDYYYSSWRNNIQNIIINLLKSDPVGACVELKRLVREENICIKNSQVQEEISLRNKYLQILEYLHTLLSETTLLNIVKDNLAGHIIGSRSIYKNVFRPLITPDFMFTRLMASPPLDGEEIDSYSLDEDTEVNIFKVPGDIKYLYHLNPPEFKIDEDKYEILDIARQAMVEHTPSKEEFTDPEKIRNTFFNIGRDLIQELAEHKGIELTYKESEGMAKILVRYTIGFGLIEILLKDPKIQDISVNSPIGETRIFIVHQDYDECVTNIIPAKDDGESWATKFRLLSARPLDEANPVLDTELLLPWARARVAVITRPLSPNGLAYALRRHRDEPWTYPLFIKGRMINSLAAGLLSFIIDGGRTMLFAGTRSSGKSSILGATMIEIMRKYKIISLEDTLELPTTSLRKLGYNIQTMKTRSALTKESSEMAADEGIRTSLRLGDSSLIIGEIRSKEAQALWEAMRIGALANVVAGTIHGADPYSVYDRVVNDLKVPKTSFKATDIIVISNPIKTADGMHKKRRVLQITEVRKHWEKDPLRENGFLDLMKYDSKEDTLKPSDDLINGESEVLKSIASNIKEYVGNWDAVWDNILLRARIKQTLVDYSIKLNKDSVLEAGFVILGNDTFHQISDRVREEVGYIDSKRVYFEWEEWLRREIKKDNMG